MTAKDKSTLADDHASLGIEPVIAPDAIDRSPITLSARQVRYLRVKRVVDLAVLVVTAPLTVPLIAAISLLVLAFSGRPVFYTQLRTGRYGRRFRIYKFSTMVRNADELKLSLAHLNVLPPPDFKIPNDPRITKVGKVLRKTSLDELPQLLNLLRGDMTLVGPRPTSFAPETYSPWHHLRLEVPQGLTGLWQIRGRGSISFDDRVVLDREYIRTMSPSVDFKIICGTVLAVIRRKGA